MGISTDVSVNMERGIFGAGPLFPERSVWLGLKNANMSGSNVKNAAIVITAQRLMFRVVRRSSNLTSFAKGKENERYIRYVENNVYLTARSIVAVFSA
jgi:hypothetical protein